MDIRKTLIPNNTKGQPVADKPREYIFFKVQYNHFREVSGSSENAVLDREEIRECECALLLPEDYSDTGAPTQLILACHGAWGRVCMEDNAVGGTRQVGACIDAGGYAALDVCGSELHGTSLGCPEHIFALYKAYRYAVTHYNLTEKVLLYGGSMGGQTAMNFANTFPHLVIAAGLCFPRLNMDGYTVDDHYVIGTWDKTKPHGEYPGTKDLIRQIYRFPGEAWNDDRTAGFNPHRSRSFVDCQGERVVFPPCPIKIWQGTADKTVDPVGTQAYVRAVRRGGSYIELRMLEGVGHTVTPVMREEMKLWFDRFI